MLISAEVVVPITEERPTGREEVSLLVIPPIHSGESFNQSCKNALAALMAHDVRIRRGEFTTITLARFTYTLEEADDFIRKFANRLRGVIVVTDAGDAVVIDEARVEIDREKQALIIANATAPEEESVVAVIPLPAQTVDATAPGALAVIPLPVVF